MSGHSKWSTIKRKKGAADAKRGKLFSKLVKEITVAARSGGGGDINANPRLRIAVDLAKSNSMPNDNIERAIKKGTGELKGGNIEEITYEAYGPEGVALILEVMTDNKNRSVAEIRHLLSKHGGNLGESGCVAWMFEKKGLISVSQQQGNEKVDEDKLMEIGLDAGLEDIENLDEDYQISCQPSDLSNLKTTLEAANIEVQNAEVSLIATNQVKVETVEAATKVLKIMDILDDHDDIQNVHANFDISEEIIAQCEF